MLQESTRSRRLPYLNTHRSMRMLRVCLRRISSRKLTLRVYKPTTVRVFAFLFATSFCLASTSFFQVSGWADSPQTNSPQTKGQSIYRQHCANCHGDQGQGTADFFDDPLQGDSSVGELTTLIASTMPEGEPELVVGKDAESVAQYIHSTFYGTAAQTRRKKPTIALSHLTAGQLRKSLADLYSHFHGDLHFDRQTLGGLSATLFDGVRWKKENHKIDRIDPTIDFDFGRDDPAEGIHAKDFKIYWGGAIVPPRTGWYEIVLRSTCACVMKFERSDFVLVDNKVQSAGREEFRRRRFLIGGRPYYVGIDFLQQKRKTEQPPAKISLSWVPPNAKEEIIPSFCLAKHHPVASYTIQTKLPPDDSSYGYARGTSVDQSWDDSTTLAAFEFASVVAGELYPYYRQRNKKKKTKEDPRGILRSFLNEFVEVAFREKMTEDTASLYVNQSLDAIEDDAMAIRRTVLMTLKSPRFLYPAVQQNANQSRRRVNRLANILLDSLPADRKLLNDAKHDTKFAKPKPLQQLSDRLVYDSRTQTKTREFLYHWLELDQLGELVKDSKTFGQFNPIIVEDLRSSLDQFLIEVVESDASDFRQLVTADWVMTNERLQLVYGDSWLPQDDNDNDQPFRRSKPDPQQHVGVLTHPLMMANLANNDTSSPIHRGVYLTRHMLGRVLRPPNEAFTPFDPELHPGLTTRQRVQLQTGEKNCQVCHSKINGLGFVLENFDAIGRYRKMENDKPVDSSGKYIDSQGNQIEFSGARELGNYLATSDDASRAFVESAFEYFVKQSPAAFGDQTIEDLHKQFKNQNYHIRKLIAAIAVKAASFPIDYDK